MQRSHELGGDGSGRDVALLAGVVAGEPPQVGAVIDVERRAQALRAGEPQGLQHRRLGARMREMRAGRDHAARVRDEGLVDVGLLQRHVGAVLAVEDQREPGLVADAEDDEGGEPLRVRDHAARVDALAGELLAQEAAHGLVADAGEHGRAQPEPRGADRDVGRRAADILAEGGHVLQPPADLGAVEIDRRAADGDHVERHDPWSLVHASATASSSEASSWPPAIMSCSAS